MSRIVLTGGPWNGKHIEDSGTILIRMGIATEWKGNRPKIGSTIGCAHYEPNEDRSRAFWLTNVWDGVCVSVIE